MTEQINQYDPRGRKHGIWKDTYPGGEIFWERRFHEGHEHGLWRGFFITGVAYKRIYFIRIK
jgi:antitoxin component YwqK of YwqJK toxin-antitoxin module